MIAGTDAGAPLALALYQDTATVLEILRSARTIAIIELSSNPYEQAIVSTSNSNGTAIRPSRSTQTGRTRAVPGISREAVPIDAKTLWRHYNIISPQGIAIAE